MKQLNGYSSDIFTAMDHFVVQSIDGNKLFLLILCNEVRFSVSGEISEYI